MDFGDTFGDSGSSGAPREAPARRFVPPPMPAPLPTAAATTTYPRRKYELPVERTWQRTLAVWGACGAIIVVAVVTFIYLMTPAEMRQYQAAKAMVEPDDTTSGAATAQPTTAQPAAARTAPDSAAADAFSGEAWTGALRLDDEHARITVCAMPATSAEAHDYSTTQGSHPAVAVLSVDNSASARPLLLDTSHCTLQFADGHSAAAMDSLKVFRLTPRGSTPGDANLTNPMTTLASRAAATTKLVFLPAATDLRRLRSITLNVNDQPRAIAGDLVSPGVGATTQPLH